VLCRFLFAVLLTSSLIAQERRDLRLELVRSSLTGTHCRYRVYEEGLPTDDYVTRACDPSTALVEPSPQELRVVKGRIARRRVVEAGPLRRWAIDVDASTGEVLRRTPLYFNGKPALVFDPNPVAALNDPSLQDHNDAAGAVPSAAYREVSLDQLADSGGLRSPAATLVDRQPPAVAPPDVSGSLLFDREQDGFEDVNALFHIQRSQDHLRELGYTGARAVVPYSIEVDAHAINGADNSFFLPSLSQQGRGTLYYGEGGTDDAEDADLVVHEYGHAILEWIAPGTFGGAFGGQPRAIAEGFGDYWAYSAHNAMRRATGRDRFCFADWDARCWEDAAAEQCGYAPGTDCLRRLDSPRTMADYRADDTAGTEHLNGAIWSSALREILDGLIDRYGAAEGRTVADGIVLESLFETPPQPTFRMLAFQMLDADRLLTGGANAGVICAAMRARGIVTACSPEPRGELTFFQSVVRDAPIPDNDSAGVSTTVTVTDERAIERLLVRVDVDHPVRGDLQIELIAPDGATFVLQNVGIDRADGVHVTYGLDAEPVDSLEALRGRAAAGTWTLHVSDVRFLDAGTLRSWGLLIQFAGESPSDERPRSETTQMIPVVAHRPGANDTMFRSDVRIANPGSTPATTTLVFTPSDHDGSRTFSAIRVDIDAGRTVSFDDVVSSAFGMTGSGSLEVLGDVVIASRTYHTDARGTLGQQVPPVTDSTMFDEPPLHVAGLDVAGERFNLGITEIAGGSGTVRITTPATEVELEIHPWSHFQIAVEVPDAKLEVVSGTARIGGYLSQVDNATGDAMLLPARPLRPLVGVAPALSATGVDGTLWQTDYWAAVPVVAFPFIADVGYHANGVATPLLQPDGTWLDLVGTELQRPGTVGTLAGSFPPELLAYTRIRGEGTSQYVPFLEPDGPAIQDLAYVETGVPYRTNVGFVAFPGEDVLAEVLVFDASGTERQRFLLWTSEGLAQAPIAGGVIGGRARVQFLRGRGHAYLSLIDNRTTDATLIH
jgi:subtilisin-like proprotein convertase family protein